MAKSIWQARVFAGGPLFAASTATQVTVIDKADDTLASLWSDRDGLSVKANPFFITVAGKIEMYLDPGRYRVTAVNAGQTDTWEDVLIIDPDAGGGGGGATDFTDLDDVPSSYSGQAGKGVRVNSGASGLEFYTPAADRRTVTAVTSSGGVVAFNYALGDYFTISMSENITSASVSNPPSSGVGGTIAIRISQDSTPRTFAFPANWQFTDSSPLTTIPTGSGDDALLIMTTFDSGTVWFATMDTLA